MLTFRNWPGPKATLAIAFVCYAATVLLFEFTSLDLALQDRFYDAAAHRWLIAEHAALPKAIFYNGPKIALYVLGAGLFAVALGWKRFPNWTRREAFYILLCMAVIPISIAIIKKLTGVCCPWELTRYGGEHEHRDLFAAIQAHERCRCYPSGHAAGGFGLFGFAFAGRKKSFAPGLIAGWTMGIFQMLRGAHFLSHTLASLFIGLIVASALALAFKLPDPK
jgi:membrane-associated PAP2 superfamily phosphatase